MVVLLASMHTGVKCALLFVIDKRMSGSSLEGETCFEEA